ncbi:MAG: hypothetical protein ACE5NW_04360 [Acidiferrobacterales bacterium]
MSASLNQRDFEVERVLTELAAVGATSVRIFPEDFRLTLLKEAESYRYRPGRENVGSGDRIVRQQLSVFDAFADTSMYRSLKEAFQELVDQSLANLRRYPFATPLHFNSMTLQRYDSGSLGITPHRDNLSYINLVCIFVVAGNGSFHICADRSGTGTREIPAPPGHVILMKAPGFLGTKDRPFHYVTGIQQPRYTFGLRQDRAHACAGVSAAK